MGKSIKIVALLFLTLTTFLTQLPESHANLFSQLRAAYLPIKSAYSRSYSSVYIPTERASQIWATLKNQGEGITVAVMDSGISPHPDLGSRIIGFKDLLNGRSDPYDDECHGTYCAGCIAGDGTLSGGKYQGIAPKASLVGVKVINESGGTTPFKVADGIRWCIENKDHYNIRIISLSLGFGIPYYVNRERMTSFGIPHLNEMINHARNHNIVVIASAGNCGPDPSTIKFPAMLENVITVGATTDSNLETCRVAPFSARGPVPSATYEKPDVVAPGVNVVSLLSNEVPLPSSKEAQRIDQHYFFASGTSVATPIVAGIAALMIHENPALTPEQVKSRLKETADPLPGEPATAQGAGQVNTLRCLANPEPSDSHSPPG